MKTWQRYLTQHYTVLSKFASEEAIPVTASPGGGTLGRFPHKRLELHDWGAGSMESDRGSAWKGLFLGLREKGVTIPETEMFRFLKLLPPGLNDISELETDKCCVAAATAIAWSLVNKTLVTQQCTLSDDEYSHINKRFTGLDEQDRISFMEFLVQLRGRVASVAKLNQTSANRLRQTLELTGNCNFMLSLRLIVTSHAVCHAMPDAAGDFEKIRSFFGWCTGFSAAFSKGMRALSEWFTMHGFLHTLYGDQDGSESSAANPASLHLPSQFQSVHREAIGSAKATLEAGHEGIQKVFVETLMANGQKQKQCIALLVKIPVLLTEAEDRHHVKHAAAAAGAASGHDVTNKQQGDSNSKEWAIDTRVETDLVIPGAAVGFLDVQWPTEDKCKLFYETFVISAPRVHFFLHCADICASDGAGLRLTGVHGAGKSTTLRALAGILSVGSPTDVWFIQNALLLPRPSVHASFLRTSTGDLLLERGYNYATTRQILISGGAGTSATEAASIVPPVLGKDQDREPPTLSTWLLGIDEGTQTVWDRLVVTEEHFARAHSSTASTGIKLMIMDEVNKPLRQKSFGGLDFLEWKRAFKPRCLRILASSPDGCIREAHHRGFEPQFFELRPAPAEHMAAILSVAPEHVAPAVSLVGDVPYGAMLRLCKKYGSNLRYLAIIMQRSFLEAKLRLNQTEAEAKLPVPDFLSAMDHVNSVAFEAFVGTLADRLCKSMDGIDDEQTRDASRSVHLVRAVENKTRYSPAFIRSSASLVVREDACNEASEGVSVGDLSFQTQLEALRRIVYLREGSAKRRDHIALALLKMDDVSGLDFENAVGARLHFGVLSRKAVRLGFLPNYRRLANSARPSRVGQFGENVENHGHVSALWRVKHEFEQDCTFIKCETIEDVPLEVNAWLKVSAAVSCLVICTVDSFPFCDFVVIYKNMEKFHVLFIEATKSALYEHAKKKSACFVPKRVQTERTRYPRRRSARAATAATVMVECPVGLRDLAKMVHEPKFATVEDQETGQWKFVTNENSEKHQSVGNCFLEVLDAPCRFSFTAERQCQPSAAAKPEKTRDMFCLDLRILPGREHEATNWTVAVVFVTGAPLGKQNTLLAFEQLRCDFAYCVYKEHCDCLSIKDISPNTSPASDSASTSGSSRKRTASRDSDEDAVHIRSQRRVG